MFLPPLLFLLLLPFAEPWHSVALSRSDLLKRSIAVAAAVITQKPQASLAGDTQRAQEVAKVVERDFVQGKYLITGDITESIYRPDCQFTDPTTNVHGVKKYTDAVKVLFDGNSSSLKLLSKPEVSSDGKEVTAQWELSGYLKFPWHPYVKPYTGTTVFTLDEKGLISSHAETWSISALDAALATITPTPGPGKE